MSAWVESELDSYTVHTACEISAKPYTTFWAIATALTFAPSLFFTETVAGFNHPRALGK